MPRSWSVDVDDLPVGELTVVGACEGGATNGPFAYGPAPVEVLAAPGAPTTPTTDPDTDAAPVTAARAASPTVAQPTYTG